MLACSQLPQKSYFKECDWPNTTAAMFSPCHSLPTLPAFPHLIPSHPHTCPSTSNQYLSTHLSFFFSLWNCLPCWLRTCCFSSCLPRLQPAFEYLPLYHNRDSSWHVLSILMWENEIAARCFWFQPVEVWIAECLVTMCYRVHQLWCVLSVCQAPVSCGDTWLVQNVQFLSSEK